MKKLGLALGAGGSRGVAHIGFLQALDDNGVVPYCISGCSMGSVVGGLYCKGMSPSEMKNVVVKLKSVDLLDFSVAPLTNKAILKTQKMKKLLDKYFGDVTFEELKIPFTCNAFDINSAKTVYFNEGKVADAVKASSSIPSIFRPMQIGDKLLIDGGTVNRVPVEAAYKMGAEVVVAVDVLGKLRNSFDDANMITHILRIVDALDWYITSEKYKAKNYDLLLMPELGDMSQYLVKKLDFAYDQGYKIGIDNIEKIKDLIK